MSQAPLGVVLAPEHELWSIPGLAAFLPEASKVVRAPVPFGMIDAVLGGYGLRSAGYCAAIASRFNAKLLWIDDGFVRSVGGRKDGALPVSLVVDPIGRHDDPLRPSALENLLNAAPDFSEAVLREAASLMVFKREHGLSRFNHGADSVAYGPTARLGCRILIIDPTAEETGPAATAAGPQPLGRMIAAARIESAGAPLAVLRSRVAGDRDHLAPLLQTGDTVLDASVDVMNLIEQMDAVYVLSSLIGLDALVAGRRVVCFGQPFYAGWGLTDDRAPRIERRRQHLNLESLFAAAYLLYPRYVDPLTGRACSARIAFERLATFKRHARRVAGQWVGLNIPPPKHPVLRAFLAGPHSRYSPSRWSTRESDDQIRFAAWASKPNEAVRTARRSHPDQIAYIEDGFLRSVGLGSNFHPAASLVLDRTGIYYDPATVSDLERILNETVFDAATLAHAEKLRNQVVELGLSKYNLALPGALPLEGATDRCILLVPGQVEDDASVKTGGQGWSNLLLLRTVRSAHPDAFILYKEHPDVTAGNRVGRIAPSEAQALADVVVQNFDILACIKAADEIHTLTSLTGFEALLRGKPVTTYGLPFYGGWGLTVDRQAYPRPRRNLSLNALVAGALLLYPLYLDPISRLPCDAETFIERLQHLRAAAAPVQHTGLAGQLNRAWRATAQSLAPRRPRRY